MADAVRVALDAMGGDHAPDALVAGALRAVRTQDVDVLLVGDPDRLRPLLPDPLPPGLSVVAQDRSAVDTACELVASGRADVVLSAGSTGGAVLAATRHFKRLPGLLRPAIAVTLPTTPAMVLVDAGAVSDADSDMLTQFAILGSLYARAVLDVPNPSVGLLNIGSEPGKGNALARGAYERLTTAPIRFHGNVEGGDLIRPVVDVVVTDGFTGNVALKLFEAALGLDPEAERDDVDSTAALVGLERTVLIAHGAARATAVVSGCGMARRLVRGAVVDGIRDRLGELT